MRLTQSYYVLRCDMLLVYETATQLDKTRFAQRGNGGMVYKVGYIRIETLST